MSVGHLNLPPFPPGIAQKAVVSSLLVSIIFFPSKAFWFPFLKNSEETPTPDKKVISTQLSEENIFSHLHNHSQFSVLQSTSGINDLVKRAGDTGCPAVAITDHGNMYGAFLFWEAVEKHNKGIKQHNAAIDAGEKQDLPKKLLKAIIGSELNICQNHLSREKQDNGFTQVLLAKNKNGYQNLSKLTSIGFVDGFYYLPRIDKEVLLRYKEGLIATTGGLNSEIANLILNVGETQAEEAFKWWLGIFGDDFYVELNRHKLPEEDHLNQVLIGFANKYNVKYFAANSNYYLEKRQSNSHDILLCVKEGELQETPIGKGRGFRFGYPNDEFYFKTPEEMKILFHDLPEAIATTNEIVEKIELYKLGCDVLFFKFSILEEFKDV